jgi:hypothetical protein
MLFVEGAGSSSPAAVKARIVRGKALPPDRRCQTVRAASHKRPKPEAASAWTVNNGCPLSTSLRAFYPVLDGRQGWKSQRCICL